MANDFCSDPNCKALWRFENGALTVDDIGTNTLTSHGTPTAELVLFKEGAASVELQKIGGDYYDIADAGLDAGFPLKNGDAIKKISVCFWLRMDTVPSMLTHGKIWTKEGSLSVRAYNTGAVTRMEIELFNGGSNIYFHGGTLVVDRWYHVGVTYQDSDQRYRIQIWDDTAGAKLDVDRNGLGVNVALTANPMKVSHQTLGQNIDGYIDEMVIFNRVLAESEIDDVKDGTFSRGGDLAVFGSLTNLFWFVKKSTGLLAKL